MTVQPDCLKRSGSVWNCLWGHALKRSPGIIHNSRVSYPCPGFLSSATWPLLLKKHYNGLIIIIRTTDGDLFVLIFILRLMKVTLEPTPLETLLDNVNYKDVSISTPDKRPSLLICLISGVKELASHHGFHCIKSIHQRTILYRFPNYCLKNSLLANFLVKCHF